METQAQKNPQMESSDPPMEDMIACVKALDAALLLCLPPFTDLKGTKHETKLHEIDNSQTQVQELDDSGNASHQIDVKRHVEDFMEAAKKLQLYFIGLQHKYQPTKEETLRKVIFEMEEELKMKNEIIEKHERLIQGWRKELKEQLDKHKAELERV